ncbi:hypothetical protein GT370_00955 [Acidocella sp. MX-AZ03]|uniref:hypothetical protein n=1 Tax=Acidocella sp. MX-AZ03 TaxID=2697363 RepID=UPI0022DCEBB1|nr:hypothetical protein [Acidocella sp. MX-AZ03]WBO59548.1 hypothetical protein GT370_00955 [Acidocella sp. MX-AZ03]
MITDPRKEALAAQESAQPQAQARLFLGQEDIFGAGAAGDEALVDELATALRDLRVLSVREALRLRLRHENITH